MLSLALLPVDAGPHKSISSISSFILIIYINHQKCFRHFHKPHGGSKRSGEPTEQSYEHKNTPQCLKNKFVPVGRPFWAQGPPPWRRPRRPPTPPSLGAQARPQPTRAAPQPPRRLGAPPSTLVEVETQNRAPAHTGALRSGAAARRASGGWGRCKAARGCKISEWGWLGDWGARWGLVGARAAHLLPTSCREGVARG